MKKKILIALLLPLFLSTSCSNWLDVVPEGDITTIDSDFETYSGAEDWLQSCYVFLQFPYILANNVAFWGSDEMVADDYLLNSADHPSDLDILAGRQNVLNPYDQEPSAYLLPMPRTEIEFNEGMLTNEERNERGMVSMND